MGWSGMGCDMGWRGLKCVSRETGMDGKGLHRVESGGKCYV